MEQEKEIIEVWITKSALTSGIEHMRAEKYSETMVRSKRHGFYVYFHGNDWHTSLDAAKKRAEEMRRRKIASLEKQVEKLKKLEF